MNTKELVKMEVVQIAENENWFALDGLGRNWVGYGTILLLSIRVHCQSACLDGIGANPGKESLLYSRCIG